MSQVSTLRRFNRNGIHEARRFVENARLVRSTRPDILEDDFEGFSIRWISLQATEPTFLFAGGPPAPLKGAWIADGVKCRGIMQDVHQDFIV